MCHAFVSPAWKMQVATPLGLTLVETAVMPANNLTLVFAAQIAAKQ